MKVLINILIKRWKIFACITLIRRKQGREGKNEFISKEIVKQAINVCGMIISVKLRHILQIFSVDDLK